MSNGRFNLGYGGPLKSIISASLTAFILLTSGCGTAPPRVDPFANLNRVYSANPLYGNMTVALIPSENTNTALKTLETSRTWTVIRKEFNYDKVFGGWAEIFKNNFKHVMKAQSLEEARAAKVDLVVLVDVYIKLPAWRWEPQTIDSTTFLMNPKDGSLIDEIKVHGEKKMSDSGNRQVGEALDAASEMAQKQLEGKLLTSANLLAYARSKSSSLVEKQPPPLQGRSGESSAAAGHPDTGKPLSESKERPDRLGDTKNDQIKVAVWDLVPRNTPATHATELTSILVSEISKLGTYEVYSQENVRTLAGWTAERMQLGCTDSKCLTALGQMDVGKLISGSVGKIGDRYSVSLNLFDTQKARSEKSISEFCRSENELIDLIQMSARKLLTYP
jgi:hypothetical protein